jgi:nitroreductase
MSDFTQIVEKRRSVRLFDGQPVPEDVVQRCLDLAMKSASSSNMQPWEFHWVRTPAVKSELVKVCLSQPAAGTAGELIVCIARTKTWDRVRANTVEQLLKLKAEGVSVPEAALSYYASLTKKIYTLGLMGAFKRGYFFWKGLKEPTMRGPVSERDMELWAVKSTALACQTLMLAFQAEGYDTCPMEGFDPVRLRKLLKFPSDAHTVMVLGVGKARPNTVMLPRIRAERDWFVKIV